MKPQTALDRITDAVLAYKPKDKGEWAKRKAKAVKKTSKPRASAR